MLNLPNKILILTLTIISLSVPAESYASGCGGYGDYLEIMNVDVMGSFEHKGYSPHPAFKVIARGTDYITIKLKKYVGQANDGIITLMLDYSLSKAKLAQISTLAIENVSFVQFDGCDDSLKRKTGRYKVTITKGKNSRVYTWPQLVEFDWMHDSVFEISDEALLPLFKKMN